MSNIPITDELFGPLWAKDDPPTDAELHEVTKSHRRLERKLAEIEQEILDLWYDCDAYSQFIPRLRELFKENVKG